MLKYLSGLLGGLLLLMSMPSTPAKAGARDAAVAAGIVGAIGTAIIMQQHFQQQPRVRRVVRQKERSRKPDAASQTTNAKDPFAGSQAPAGYATPVMNKQ